MSKPHKYKTKEWLGDKWRYIYDSIKYSPIGDAVNNAIWTIEDKSGYTDKHKVKKLEKEMLEAFDSYDRKRKLYDPIANNKTFDGDFKNNLKESMYDDLHKFNRKKTRYNEAKEKYNQTILGKIEKGKNVVREMFDRLRGK